MTYVPTPTMRYHPAVVAQKAATTALLAEGRFRLGLGAGEQFNAHVIGNDFPAVKVHHQMLAEVVEIIRRLFTGDFVTHYGDYFDVESARLFDLPDEPPAIGIAVSGPESCRLAVEMADLMIAVEPKRELDEMFATAAGDGRPVVGQPTVCWGPDEAACRKLAYEQFAWSLGGWKIQSELPNTVSFAAFSQAVSQEQVAQRIPCGPDADGIVQAVKRFVDAGYTEVALVQVGPNQPAFCDFFAHELGPGPARALRWWEGQCIPRDSPSPRVRRQRRNRR